MTGVPILLAWCYSNYPAFKVKHLLTSAYHPQCDGQGKRLIQTLTKILSHYVTENQKNWDLLVPFAAWCMNTIRQETTKYTALDLVQGRQPISPLDLALSFEGWQEIQSPSDYLTLATNWLETARQVALEKVEWSFDEKVLVPTLIVEKSYYPSQLVLEWRPGLATKFPKTWKGPYVVEKQTSPVNHQICNIKRKKKFRIVHVVRLKFFNTGSEDECSGKPNQPETKIAQAILVVESFDQLTEKPETDLSEFFKLATTDVTIRASNPAAISCPASAPAVSVSELDSIDTKRPQRKRKRNPPICLLHTYLILPCLFAQI